ncbi:hypothetical protein LIER_35048 [Lithospermum erythrorhizon]|uniref:Replication factor A C-terminal domain-containing protein n=1 Tax=Lithospermum erythrorhizon TaxID=34254 RepID=A0AAV3NN69_LITER
MLDSKKHCRFDSLPESELQKIMSNQSIVISKELVCKGSIEVYTVAEIDNLLESGDYWVKGFLQLSEEHQKLFYVGCSNCHSKIDIEDIGIHYECHVCNKNVVTTLRPFVVLSIIDHTSTAKPIAMGDVAETILQNSISNTAKLTKLGLDYDLQSIRSELDGRQFMMFLRHSSNANNEAIQESTLSDQPEIIESLSSLSPLKRQMNQMSIDTGTKAKRQLTYIFENKNLEEKDTKEPDA